MPATLEANLFEKRGFQGNSFGDHFRDLPRFFRNCLGTEHPNDTDVNVTGDYEWRSVADGLVNQPLNLTLSQIVAMPETKANADLYCFNTLVYAANWVVVKLSALLEESGLLDRVEYIQFVALDMYATFVDISTALREDVILAHELNGQSLPEILRRVRPYENGDKWIAPITKITAVTVPVSAPAQPNLTPTTFQEASKSQAGSSLQPSDEPKEAVNETTYHCDTDNTIQIITNHDHRPRKASSMHIKDKNSTITSNLFLCIPLHFLDFNAKKSSLTLKHMIIR